MDPKANQFLSAVLGDAGAAALKKAADRAEGLELALLPRTILAWMNAAPMYEGALPGLEDTYVSFSKSETGFTGSITIGEGLYKFENETLFHVAGAIAVSVGFTPGDAAPEAIRNIDIERLGKSIDMLAKARRANEEMAKAKRKPEDEHLSDEEYERKYDLEKKQQGGAGGTGQAAAPIAPAAAANPTPTAPPPSKATMVPTPPKIPTVKPPKPAKPMNTMKLARSEADSRCDECGGAQFFGEKFTGCLCFRALAKSARVLSDSEDGVVLQFGEDWDAETTTTFLQAVGRK